MSYLERAITDGHAKLTGEGKQQAVPALNGGQRDFSLSASNKIPRSRERERMSVGQVRVVGEKQFNAERAGARCRSLQLDERKKPYAVIECKADGVTDAEFNQAVEQACGNGTWAKFRANYVGVVAGMTRRFFDFSGKFGGWSVRRTSSPICRANTASRRNTVSTRATRTTTSSPSARRRSSARSRNATRPFGRAANSR
jgi:hypothetical protein